jgi:hypothetical protein
MHSPGKKPFPNPPQKFAVGRILICKRYFIESVIGFPGHPILLRRKIVVLELSLPFWRPFFENALG